MQHKFLLSNIDRTDHPITLDTKMDYLIHVPIMVDRSFFCNNLSTHVKKLPKYI